MTTLATGPLPFLTAALVAGACLAGLSTPAAAQDREPALPNQPSPAKKDDPHRALPLKKSLPRIDLGELTEEEDQVSVRRPITQGRLQVIYVFSSSNVEDTSWLERVMSDDKPGVRATLERMHRLAELETFKGRVAWSAIAVPGYPKSSLAAGFEATATDGTLADEAQGDKTGADKTGADKTEADKTEADETVGDKAKADKAKADKAKADKMKADDAKADRAKADEADKAKADSVVTAPLDSVEARTFLRKLKSQTDAEFPFLIDTDGKLVSALGIRSNLVLVVDAKGVIQFAATELNTMDVGASNKNAADSDYLRRALNELLDGHTEVSAPYGKFPTPESPKTNDAR